MLGVRNSERASIRSSVRPTPSFSLMPADARPLQAAQTEVAGRPFRKVSMARPRSSWSRASCTVFASGAPSLKCSLPTLVWTSSGVRMEGGGSALNLGDSAWAEVIAAAVTATAAMKLDASFAMVSPRQRRTTLAGTMMVGLVPRPLVIRLLSPSCGCAARARERRRRGRSHGSHGRPVPARRGSAQCG